MALNLIYPLKKGTYHRVRDYQGHVKANAGPWFGIDDGCKVGTPIYAVTGGKISHAVKQSSGGGWNFRLNFSKYPGWFYWYAHDSQIPFNGKVFKAGQIIGKSGATGWVSGPHLHHSLLYKGVPKDQAKNVTWVKEVDMYTEKPKKYSDGKPRDAKGWFLAYADMHKKRDVLQNRVAVLEKEVARIKKNLDAALAKTTADYQKVIEKLSGDLTAKDATIYGLKQDYTAARMEAAERNKEVLTCQKEIKEAYRAAQGLKKVQEEAEWSLVVIWRFIKDLFRKKVI